MPAEDIGTVAVSIRGDYSQLGADFDAAAQIAIAKSAQMAVAINATMSAAFAQNSPLQNLTTSLNTVSTQFTQVGTTATSAFQSVSPAATQAGNAIGAALGPEGTAGKSLVGSGLLVRALGQEIGVGLPRALSSVLANIGPVSSALQAAFLPIVALGFIEVLAKVVTKVGEVIDALGGWDAKTQAVAASIEAQNEHLYQSYEKIAEAIDNISTIGKTGAEKYIAEQGNVQKAIQRVNQDINDQRAALAKAVEAGKQWKNPFDDATNKNIEQQFHQIPAIEANIQRLTEVLRELSQVKGPTVAAEATAALGKEALKTGDAIRTMNFGQITGAMNEFQIAAAIAITTFKDQMAVLQQDVVALTRYQEALANGTTLLRQAGETISQYRDRIRETNAALAEGPPIIEENAKEFKKLADPNTLLFLKQLDDQMQATALGPGRQLAQVFKDFNLKDPDAQVQKFIADLKVLGTIAEAGQLDAVTFEKAWMKTFQAAEAAGVQFSTKLQVQMGAVDFALKAAQDQAKLFGNVLQGVSQNLAAGLVGIATGAETVRQAVGNMLKDIAQQMISVVVEQGIAAILRAIGLIPLAALTSSIAQIQDAAAVAFANTYAAISAIPIVGPFEAPAAAAAAEATVLSAEGLLAFDKGGWVPEDMIAQVHQGEYVVPAAEASSYVSGARGNSPVYITANFNGHPRENAREFAKLLKVSAPQFTY